MKKGKMKIGTIILIVVCFVGLAALLYPSVANFWNENIATSAITDYVEELEKITEEDYQQYWDEAIQYNRDIAAAENVSVFSGKMQKRYHNCLNVNNLNIMGYIDIPKIDVSLPIYHGTDDSVLATSVGHLEWTSLPTGGESTHCCLSAHRGLPSAKLFTNLDQLREGDTFTLSILNEVLTYEVDQIRTVLPNELKDLQIVEGKDYCTLITCTPYGINTHRILVRGHRIENIAGNIYVVADAVLIDQLIVAVALEIPILFALVMMVMLKKPEPKKPELVKTELKKQDTENEIKL